MRKEGVPLSLIHEEEAQENGGFSEISLNGSKKVRHKRVAKAQFHFADLNECSLSKTRFDVIVSDVFN